ncbi:MAG: ferrous iron transport protein B [Eubacteriales bacterium]|nr:ferrous iron transport protein B [Eubacteriales bacterium]
MTLLLALAGNQNSGKTTLFNQLTGSNQHVGNFPGVTVEKKEGVVKKHKDVSIVDLPGIYSLSPYSSEEVVSRNFLVEQHPCAIINIVDATNLERNLYLTLQLLELGIPMVIALNMMDEVRANNGFIDIKKLEEELGVPVVPIAASKNEGVAELIRVAIETAQQKHTPKRLDFCTGEVHKAIHAVSHLVEKKAALHGYAARFAASKLIEGDPPLAMTLDLSDGERDILGHFVSEMESALGTDREAALADMRYSYIEGLIKKAVIRPRQSREQSRSVKIDSVLTHRILAIPIFLLIMLAIFWLTFGVVGSWLSGLFNLGIDALTGVVDGALIQGGVSGWMHSLIIDGIFAGVGSVLGFLPVILLLFFFLSILEDTGYMARVAFVMDKLLRRIGLSGRSFVPMLIGFGCSVPAIMATRTLSSDRDRKMTVILTPFMSCSAKLPIYAVFTAAFFQKNQALVMISLYVLGIAVAALSGLLLKKTVFKGNPTPFVMELPTYRFPSPKSVILHMWDKAKDFIRRAFTIIFVATIVIWFLQSLDWSFNMVNDSRESMLASIGAFLSPVFAPLGFGDWRASTAIIAGLSAKEAVVSTLSVLLRSGQAGIPLNSVFTPLAAFAFLCFTLLYMPCVAALAATKREIGSAKGTALIFAYQTAVAWIIAFIVYQGGRIIGLI